MEKNPSGVLEREVKEYSAEKKMTVSIAGLAFSYFGDLN